jgi:YesN/AraC family two-component response regulator
LYNIFIGIGAKTESIKKGPEAGSKSFNEPMYSVGYSDVKAFRTVFKRTTALSPVEYKNKLQGWLWQCFNA